MEINANIGGRHRFLRFRSVDGNVAAFLIVVFGVFKAGTFTVSI